MAVKLGRYIFRKIGGRIIPIRANVLGRKLPTAVDETIHAIKKIVPDLSKVPKKFKIGSGIDFDVTKQVSSHMGDVVLKIPRPKKTRSKIAKRLMELFPGIEKPGVRASALSKSLPNYGVPTVEAHSVRLTKGKIGILQEYAPEKASSADVDYLRREVKKASEYFSGLDLDANTGNIASHGRLRDAGLGKLPTLSHTRNSSVKELFEDIPRENRRPDFVSELAMVEGQSSKILRKINALKKKGYRLRKLEKNVDDFYLLSPTERLNRINKMRKARKK